LGEGWPVDIDFSLRVARGGEVGLQVERASRFIVGGGNLREGGAADGSRDPALNQAVVIGAGQFVKFATPERRGLANGSFANAAGDRAVGGKRDFDSPFHPIRFWRTRRHPRDAAVLAGDDQREAALLVVG